MVVMPPVNPTAPKSLQPPQSQSVLIVGGGIAGLSAALELADRNYKVTIMESSHVLGGRVEGHQSKVESPKFPLTSESTFNVEHGFHAWFHNYHNFKDIRTRIGINENFKPWEKVDYIFKTYKPESLYSEGPYPLNLLQILQRSPNMKLLDVLKLLGGLGDLMFYNFEKVYRRYDNITFYQWAHDKRIDPVFFEIMMEPAMSVTLNDPQNISAATMLTLMQLYFLSDADADKREVIKGAFNVGLINPWAKYLQERGVDIRVNTRVTELVFSDNKVSTVSGQEFDHVILACDIPGLKSIVRGSQTDSVTKNAVVKLEEKISQLELAPPYRVLRVWFNAPLRSDRPIVLETPQHRPINLIARYDFIQDEYKEWCAENNGAVVEFHLYNWPDLRGSGSSTWESIKDVVYSIYPELADAEAIGFTLQKHFNFPSYAMGQESIRPETDFPLKSLGIKNLYFAGDYVHTNYPSALMERAVSTGREAANAVLLATNVQQAPLYVATKYGPGLI